jgi:hypothetical protein
VGLLEPILGGEARADAVCALHLLGVRKLLAGKPPGHGAHPLDLRLEPALPLRV